jgi:hypothetical protein
MKRPFANLKPFQNAAFPVSWDYDLAEKRFAVAKIECGAAQKTPLGGRAAPGCRQYGV